MASTAARGSRSTLRNAEDSRFGEGISIADEIVIRACAVADGVSGARTRTAGSRAFARRLDECERRARRLAAGSPTLAPAAALEFVGGAIAAASVDGIWPAGASETVVGRVAEHLDATEADASLVVFRAAVSAHACVGLPPALATDFVLSLLVDLGAAAGVSLWTATNPGSTEFLAGAGRGARSRRMRETARSTLDGVPSHSEIFLAILVERWDQPFAALVARARTAGTDALLVEAADALSSVLERDALHDRGAAREHRIVAAGERHLVRLGFDLHDGPLQEIVAFAEDLRVARAHIEPLLDAPDRTRAGGCFDDLTARLETLDQDLRQIAHSVRSTTALDRPLQDALQSEVDTLRRAGVETELTVTGDVNGLTNSQKIVIFRVVQEALNNVRKHSAATSADVLVRSTSRFIQVVVNDDGRGIGSCGGVAADRLGLAGVSERVGLLGGVVTIGSAPSGGAQISATLPHWRSRTDASKTSYAATA